MIDQKTYGEIFRGVLANLVSKRQKMVDAPGKAITNDAVCHALEAIQPSTLRGTCERMTK